MKFVRFRGDIINITHLVDVRYGNSRTHLDYGKHGSSYFDGNHVDELWQLIKLAMQSKDVAQPDITFLEKRVAGIEDKIGERFSNQNRKSDHDVPAGMPSHVGFKIDGTPIYERDGVLITLEA